MNRSQFAHRKSSVFSVGSLAALTVAGAAVLGLGVPAAASPEPTAKQGAGSAGSTARSTTRDAGAGAARKKAKTTAKGVARRRAAAAHLTVLSYNVCGGSCKNHLTVEAWARRMERHLTENDADVILFQELCRGQFDALRRTLSGRYEGRWAGTVGDNEGCGKQWGSGADATSNRRGFGLATFVRGSGSIVAERVWWLPNHGTNEPRALHCVDAEPRGRRVRVCNTHLDWHDDTQQVQAEFVARLVSPWAAHIPVVLGGDLNAEPDERSMALFYDHSGGRGVFQEVDETDRTYFGERCAATAARCRSGEGTDGPKKLDYIFLSRRHFTGVVGDAVVEKDVSDHALLRGRATWRNLPPRADFSWHPSRAS
jgi:endonuclease/exonuclease/phosphatase family metal-dependent hydrolase